MPQTKQQGLQFGLMMCGGMVIVMTIYNLALNGLLTQLSPAALIGQLALAFLVAFALDTWLVGPLAKKIVPALPFANKSKIAFILTLSTTIVIGMVLLMSAYGVLTARIAGNLSSDGLLNAYFTTVWHNAIVAWPLQLLIIGPLVRYLFTRFILQPAKNA